jgi:hypothetical protein
MVRAMFRFAPLALVAGLALGGCKSHPTFHFDCQELAGGVRNDMGAPCYIQPTAAPARTACSADITRSCDSTGTATPNVSCVSQAPPDMALTPASGFTQLYGYVHVYDTGIDTNNVTVSVYDQSQVANGQNPASLATLGTVRSSFTRNDTSADGLTHTQVTPDRRSGCDIDLKVGCTPIVETLCPSGCGDGYNGRPEKGQYCASDGTCKKRLRWELPYLIASTIPQGRPLVFRVTSGNGRSNNAWVTTHEWAFTVPSNPRRCNPADPAADPNAPGTLSDPRDTECLGTDVYTTTATTKHPDGTTTTASNMQTVVAYRHNVTVLSVQDWDHYAMTAGAAGGVQAGQSLIIGEAHDCDGVRLDNVQVSVTPAPARFAYLRGDDSIQAPDLTRALSGTTALGSFVAVNVAPGKTTVEAIGGKPASDGTMAIEPFGRFDFTTYADTVTLVNLNRR